MIDPDNQAHENSHFDFRMPISIVGFSMEHVVQWNSAIMNDHEIVTRIENNGE
jgi:hypothetical protein